MVLTFQNYDLVAFQIAQVGKHLNMRKLNDNQTKFHQNQDHLFDPTR